jgi:hypothetical protein
MSYRLALCFLRGLPTTESSGKLAPKTLLGRVSFEGAVSTSAGGVAPTEVLPIDAGDRRELAFRGSAEC